MHITQNDELVHLLAVFSDGKEQGTKIETYKTTHAYIWESLPATIGYIFSRLLAIQVAIHPWEHTTECGKSARAAGNNLDVSTVRKKRF